MLRRCVERVRLMTEIRLDYQHSRSFPWGGAAMLILALGGLLSVGTYYRELRGKVDEWEKQLARIERARPRQQDSTRVARSADAALEVRHANKVLRQLGLPWERLFRALESSGGKDVVLLALEPDMEKRLVKISGEARNIPAMLAYVTQLGEQDMFESVYLLNHQVQLQNQDRSVRFALVATLKGLP
jgi:hypothetical protein